MLAPYLLIFYWNVNIFDELKRKSKTDFITCRLVLLH